MSYSTTREIEMFAQLLEQKGYEGNLLEGERVTNGTWTYIAKKLISKWRLHRLRRGQNVRSRNQTTVRRELKRLQINLSDL